jgi:hypothetical protein
VTRTLMFVKAAATIVAEKITIHSGIRLSTATNPEYRRVHDGDGCERGRKAFITRTAYPQTAAPGGPGRVAQCSGVRTVAHRGEPSLEASPACRAFFRGFAVTARHDASTRLHRG